ncbi:MAG: PorV/PorQ family protein [Candidatus Eisenbacteria bacterium]|nr:PorV/PorQ family protein [Candidatus Eisenbacteria bacterium]
MNRAYRTGTLLAAAALAVSLAAPAFAVSDGAPQSIAPLMTPNARAAGMGQCFVSIADDATAGFWNPAGLAWQTGPDVVLMYSKLAEGLADDISYNYLAYSRPMWGGGLGVSMIFLNLGMSDIISEDGALLGDFNSFDFIPMVSYGATLTPDLAYGATFKFIYSRLSPDIKELGIDDGTGVSIAGDLAMLYRIPGLGVQAGVLVQNMGLDITYNDQNQPEDLPRNVKAGVTWYVLDNQLNKLLLTAEVTKNLVYWEGEAIDKFGAEYVYYDMAAGRIGYIYDWEGKITDITFGLGFKIKSIGLRFDWASVPQAEDLPRVNRFALGFNY